MRNNFFKSAGVLFTIAFAVISAILGIRAGMISGEFWEGFKVGGACACGTLLFALGINKFNKSGYDTPIAKILWGISLLGIAIFGLSLVAMSVSDIFNISPFIVEKGLILGGIVFVAPILCVAAYCCIKSLIEGGKKHPILFISSLTIATILAVAMYFVAGTWSDAFAVFFGFLFYWVGICFFAYAWKGVELEENRLLWRVGFSLVITFLSCGILNILSAILVNVSGLHEILLWVSYNVGVVAMYILFGYIALIGIVTIVVRTWKRLTY